MSLTFGLPAGGAAPVEPIVVVARLNSEIHPAAANFVAGVADHAAREGASLLILEISTPGGLMSSMRAITTTVVNSRVPVATFVYPPGARAASAGFFILLSGDVAAMAPGTNAGAAHPVGEQGEDIPRTENRKVMEDALAQIRTLCAAHHRNAAAAELAVTGSLSYTETEALQKKVIDLIAHDPADLCRQLNGRTVYRVNGGPVTLHLDHPRLEDIDMGTFDRVLGVVSEPNLAYILFLIGLVGIYFELSHPGAILPGVLGGVCLLLALFAFSVLPVNFAGVGLIVLGLIFIIAEVKFPVHGMLALAGLAALVGGALFLFSGNRAGYAVNVWILLPGAILAGAILVTLSLRTVAVRARPVTTGMEGMIGERGKAMTDLSPSGRVFVHGEYWDAHAGVMVPAGTSVRVVGKEGLALIVEAMPVDKERGNLP